MSFQFNRNIFTAAAISAVFPILAHCDPIRFAGWIVNEGEPYVVLVDAADGKSSPWLHRQQTWREYKVVGVNAKAETVSLERAGKVQEIGLDESLIRNGSSHPSAEAKPILISGHSEIIDGQIHYSPLSKISFGGWIIFSEHPMVGDGATFVKGDLIADNGSPRYTVATDGIVRLKDGKAIIAAKTLQYMLKPPAGRSTRRSSR